MGRGENENKAASKILRPSSHAERSWRKGCELFYRQNLIGAEEQFRRALDRDPQLADALLGLLAINPYDAEAIERLAGSLDRFGECQERFKMRLRSSYNPIGFGQEILELPDDVRRARAAQLSAQGNFAEGYALLDACHPCALTDAVRLRLAFDQRDWRTCVRIAQQSEMPAHLIGDVKVLVGIAFAKLGTYGAAIENLREAIKAAPSVLAQRAARYQLALAYEGSGDQKRYRQELENICAEDIDYADVAERLSLAPAGAAAKRERAPAAQPGAAGSTAKSVDEEFMEIMRGLTDDSKLADEPEIGH